MSEEHFQPPQHQEKQPGERAEMSPKPVTEREDYTPSGRLSGKTAIVTGGDSGIGRAVSILFAKEGADVAIAYLDEHADARETRQRVERTGRRCLAFSGDVGDPEFCKEVVSETVSRFGRLDVPSDPRQFQRGEGGPFRVRHPHEPLRGAGGDRPQLPFPRL